MKKVIDLEKDKDFTIAEEESEPLQLLDPASQRAMELQSYFNENILSALAILKEHLPKKEQDRFQKLIDEMIEWQLEKDKICGVEY